MFTPDELERPVQTWGKAEKREGEGFVPTSTVQGWGTGVVLHGNCEKPVFRVDAIRWSDNTDCLFSTNLTIRRAAAWNAEGLPRFALFCAESRL